ncbi:MAG: 50S ribosomal protein L25 [Phycisphaerae bacterium]|nr:50S ribosomal protein L25 [Phycisphaerae bacterium]
MHEKSPILKATKRDRVGTRYSTRIRERGGLPAVVYGRASQPESVALDAKETLTHIHKGEKVFRIQVEGAKEAQTVLLKAVQFDHLGTNVVHADFARVSLTDRVSVRVPIHLLGEAKGLKTAGAILMHPTNEIEIECVVTDIPDYIEVGVGDLDVDHQITAGDVKLPGASMKLKTDKHAILAQIVIQQEIVEAKAEEGAVEAGPAEPEVITAKKKDEEGAAPGAAKPGEKAPADKKAAPAKEDKKK